MRFIDIFDQRVQQWPDRIAVRDCNTQITHRQLDEQSGRVYAYLKARGIGREDVVMVVLPRRVHIFEAIMGIWKAGAAMVCAETDTPASRIGYIQKDCRCALVIDESNWDEIVSTPVLPGHEQTDPHDAAMIFYTSGSEGNPKGVVQEYGKLELIPQSCTLNGAYLYGETDIYGVWFPVSTMQTSYITATICLGSILDIMPAETRRDPKALRDYICQHQINVIVVVPSLVDILCDGSLPLRQVMTGAEVASNIYTDKLELVNIYLQSESGATVFTFPVDKPYEVTPIGKPTGWVEAYILDDDDKPVPTGQMGELCYRNLYTRGYLNNPVRTAEVFRNGIYHTGDIARVDEQGNYIILGRKTDMVKINGNRIEPAEIESVARRVLGLSWALAKGFVRPHRSFICLYYTDPRQIDAAEARQQMQDILPTYMLPTYFIQIDHVPQLANGKVDRGAFTPPDVQDYLTAYQPPTNELEERLCRAMQQVLGLNRIGITDDFYQLGGDSMGTIQLVAECNIPGLDVPLVMSAHTPQQIAQRWMETQLANS